MKMYAITFLFLSIFLNACQQTNGMDNTKANPVTKQQNINHFESLETVKIEYLTESKEIFYLTEDDIFDKPKYLYEHRVPATLIIYNNCLSVKTTNGSKIHTLITPNEVLFDERKNIIGLINKKSNRRILIGDNLRLSGTNSVNATSSKKPVPKECSQTLLFTGEII